MEQFHTGWFWMLIGFTFFVLWVAYIRTQRKEAERRRRPVVCLCQENGRYAIVLRDDYHRASQAEWESLQSGEGNYDAGSIGNPYGRILRVSPVFVFRDFNLFYTVTSRCYTENATFYIPHLWKDEYNDIRSAWKYLFGKEYAGEYSEF